MLLRTSVPIKDRLGGTRVARRTARTAPWFRSSQLPEPRRIGEAMRLSVAASLRGPACRAGPLMQGSEIAHMIPAEGTGAARIHVVPDDAEPRTVRAFANHAAPSSLRTTGDLLEVPLRSVVVDHPKGPAEHRDHPFWLGTDGHAHVEVPGLVVTLRRIVTRREHRDGEPGVPEGFDVVLQQVPLHRGHGWMTATASRKGKHERDGDPDAATWRGNRPPVISASADHGATLPANIVCQVVYGHGPVEIRIRAVAVHLGGFLLARATNHGCW